MEKRKEEIVVDFEPISRRVRFLEDRSAYEILTKIGVQIRSLCGGLGTCGKCKVLIQIGKEFLNNPTKAEKELLTVEELNKDWRLACQVRLKEKNLDKIKLTPSPQIRMFLPDDILLEDFKILTAGISKAIEINPTIKKLFLKVSKPSLSSPISDTERIISSVRRMDNELKSNSEFKFELNVLSQIPNILRDNDHKITLAIKNNNEIISCEPGNTLEDNYGIAFDIGTTTIVGYLINLNNGKIYAVSSKLNPQTAYGEDVITRITYIKENDNGLQKLNSAVINALNDIIIKTCSKAKISPSKIYEATIVGNSVMHHIFLGISPVSIGLSPYVPIIQQGFNVKSNDLSINISQQGNVHLLPLIAGFVGADTMGVIISSEIDKENDLTLAIDIGTNGELIVGNRERLITASCAAGSALEGAHIKYGMRAAGGSIDTVKIDPGTLDVSYTTIKGKQPIGICGSGLVDAIAEMLKSNVITRSGNFNKDLFNHDRFIKTDKTFEFIIVDKKETLLGRDLTISQQDIRQIQMAKAAFYSGARIILNFLNEQLEDPYNEYKQIFLAGAFGNYINKVNAKFIGMIPDIPDEKIFQIGNAAGIGAQHCLLNKDLRKKAEMLSKKINYVEIAIRNEFQREFAEAMYFPHLNLELFPSLKEYKSIPKR